MRDGTCDKCGGAVRQLTMGISNGGRGVTINEKLRRIEEGHGGWAPPAG